MTKPGCSCCRVLPSPDTGRVQVIDELAHQWFLTLIASRMSDVLPTRESRPAKAVAAPQFVPGQQFGGYEIAELIGKGGMGEVYRAKQLSMDREVALKILSPRLALKDPSFAQRFVDEARAAGKLNHPNIIHVHDVSTATLADGNAVHFFSMEFIDGESVQDLLDRDKHLTSEQIAPIMTAVAEALSFAAKIGIVHRDIKPDNIMITKGGLVKLADLGLAIQSQSGDDHQPERDEKGRAKVMGTPLYLSPEQARALPVDHRSDQYSLGATLFHLLTGDAPYRGPDAKSIMKSHVVDPVPDVLERYPQADPAWAQLAERLLQKKPEDRFAHTDELVEAVEAACKGVTLEQLARQKLGFQMPAWGWYSLGAGALVIAFWALMARGSAAPANQPDASPEPSAPQVQPSTPADPAMPGVTSGGTSDVIPSGEPSFAAFDLALSEFRLKDAQVLLVAADQAAPATASAAKRLQAARVEARKNYSAQVANAKIAELDTLVAEITAKPLPDEDQMWLRGTIEARRKALTPPVEAKVGDAERWKDLGRQIEKLRGTLGYDVIKTTVSQSAAKFESAEAKTHLTELAGLGELAQKGEGALRAYIGAAQPHTIVVIGGKNVDVLLNRLTRTEVFYIVQAAGAPGPEQKAPRAQVGMPWAVLLDEAMKDQGVENSPLVKAACLWMWSLPEARPAITALGDAPLAKALAELEKNRK